MAHYLTQIKVVNSFDTILEAFGESMAEVPLDFVFPDLPTHTHMIGRVVDKKSHSIEFRVMPSPEMFDWMARCQSMVRVLNDQKQEDL